MDDLEQERFIEHIQDMDTDSEEYEMFIEKEIENFERDLDEGDITREDVLELVAEQHVAMIKSRGVINSYQKNIAVHGFAFLVLGLVIFLNSGLFTDFNWMHVIQGVLAILLGINSLRHPNKEVYRDLVDTLLP